MAKTLCDWKKSDIANRQDELEALIADPQFICHKCARSACSKRVLCKPKRAFQAAAAKSKKKRDPLVVGPLVSAPG